MGDSGFHNELSYAMKGGEWGPSKDFCRNTGGQKKEEQSRSGGKQGIGWGGGSDAKLQELARKGTLRKA